MFKLLTLAITLLCLPGAVLADTTLHFALQKDGQSGRSVVYIRPGEVRTDNSGGTWMLYKAAQDTLYVVQPKRKSYIRVDRERIKQLGKQMAQARQRYQAELQKLPPKQRAQMKKSLGNLLQAPEQKKPLKLQQSGGTEQVSGVTCQSGRIVQDGQTLQSVCIAKPGALGMSGKEFSSLKSLYGLMSDLEASTGFGPGPMPDLSHLNGVPIRLKSPQSGASQHLTAVSHGSLSDKLFRIPKSYQQRTPGRQNG